MSVSTRKGAVGYAVEGTFAEAVNNYATRLQTRNDLVDISGLTQDMIDPGGVYQRMNEQDLFRRGPRGGTFSITLDVTGFGATTAGAISATDLVTLLGRCFGNATSTQVGGLLTAGTQNPTTITSTNTTIAVGELIRVGVKQDTRCDGQAAVSASATSPYTLLTAMPGTPTTADSVYAMSQIYPAENTDTVSTTMRFWLATGDQQRWARGCACTAATFAFPDGGLPSVTLTFSVAEWDKANEPFPSVTATAAKTPTPFAGGSVYIQAKATTTRTTYNARDTEFTVDQQVAPIVSGGGGGTGFQTIVGWTRVKQCGTISMSIPAEAAATSTWLDYAQTDENTIVARHILYTFGAINGKGAALYLPDAIPVLVPQQEDRAGLGYVRPSFRGRTNNVTTNELTLSNWRLGLG